MTAYTKKDFALLCGVKTKHLSTFIDRKKVILTGDLVDDQNPTNAFFMQKWRNKSLKDDLVQKEIPVKSERAVGPDKIKKDAPKSVKEIANSSIEADLKRADLAKKEADIIYREIQIQKLQGLSIPTELVKSLISNLSKSLISSFKDGADSFLIEISKGKSLSITETAKLKGELIKIINISSSKAIAESKRDIKIIVGAYSDQRGVGEHD